MFNFGIYPLMENFVSAAKYPNSQMTDETFAQVTSFMTGLISLSNSNTHLLRLHIIVDTSIRRELTSILKWLKKLSEVAPVEHFEGVVGGKQ